MNIKRAIAVSAAAMALMVFSVGSVEAQGRIQTPGVCTNPDGTACVAQQNGSAPQGRQSWQGRGRGMRGSQQPGARGQGINGGNWAVGLPPASDQAPTAEIIGAMTDGINDEYHALAVYQSVIDQFGAVRPFTNILRAEEQHVAAWTFLFERYGLDAPVAPAQIDVPEFATLSDACQAAADAEVANFDLYDVMAKTFVDYPDMQQVVTSLRNASEFNHLPAFENCAGVTR